MFVILLPMSQNIATFSKTVKNRKKKRKEFLCDEKLPTKVSVVEFSYLKMVQLVLSTFVTTFQ